MTLTADSAALGAGSQTEGEVFARQVGLFGRPGDVVVGLDSRGGHGRSLIRAFEEARQLGLGTLAIVGGDGEELHSFTDVTIGVPSSAPHHVHEVQIVIFSVLSKLLDERGRSGHRREAATESTTWTTWELRIVGAGPRCLTRAVAPS